MESVIENEADSNDTSSLMEKLRHQLAETPENNENHEESHTIMKEVNGNFLIAIERMRRKERLQEAPRSSDFNPSNFITQCCAPLPLLVRNRSSETPSTRSETLGHSDGTGSSLMSGSVSTSKGDHSAVKVFTNYCDVTDGVEEEREERLTLRCKLDILSERTCHDESLRENAPSAYWTTDTEGEDGIFTPNSSIDRDTFTASNDEDVTFDDTDTQTFNTYTDGEGESEGGDGKRLAGYDDATLEDECVSDRNRSNRQKATNGKIYILRSEDFDIGDSTTKEEELEPDVESLESGQDQLPSLVAARLKSDSGLSSATFSENGDDFVEQMEEVRNYHLSGLEDEEKMGEKSFVDYQMNETNAVRAKGVHDDDNAQYSIGITNVGDGIERAREEIQPSVPKDIHPEIASAIMSIGKALETATLNKTSAKNNTQDPYLEESRRDTDDGEPILLASQSLGSLYSKIEDSTFHEVGLLYKIPYIQGSFNAAAPFLLQDLKWMRILRRLMPSAHEEAVVQLEATRFEKGLRTAQIMKWAENNPVVAAYGLLVNNFSNLAFSSLEKFRTPTMSNCDQVPSDKQEGIGRIPPLEWCIFLDPLIVAELDQAICKRDKLVLKDDKNIASDEINKHVSRLVKRMVLSHGSTGQILSEALGMSQAFTFASIVDSFTDTKDFTDHSSTGIFANTWMAIFAAALKLGVNMELESSLVTSHQNADYSSQAFCGLMLCLGLSDTNSTRTNHEQNSFGDSAKLISSMLGAPLHLVLNVRTRRVPARVLGQLIDFMGDNSVYVEAVASFDIDDLRPLADFTISPVITYRLLHSAGDLQKACHAGEIRNGDSVFFNAASLIKTDQDTINILLCGQGEYNGEIVFADYAFPRNFELSDRRTCRATIEDYKKKFNLNIGCYLNEFALTEKKYTCMVDFFKNNSAVYNLGLSIGGINGKFAATAITGDGFARQRLMGANWNNDAKPTHSMEALSWFHNQQVQKVASAGAWGQLGTVNNGKMDWLC